MTIFCTLLSLLLLKLYNLIDKLTANKLPYLAPILLKLLKKILLIAIRICYYVILCYLVYKHSYLLTYYSLIYIRIISKNRLLGFNSIKGNITNSNSNIKI
ncbi:hypothetical protein HBH56_242730 [Parastagonospora nodorum]|nr:hypothetical protein HBH56_242730 [Parastagonospora nodorum]KAH3926151.1 hypothetical protein HBH54_173940 [Parastagonospora nodorum]KAH4133775.1 hypothetical protein HBH45_177650 [Parastagonospora nodorum]KAH4561228.1 hypothetical protein HBH84_191240 [Parastagonospora nodorum]KAH4609506.1 hypothetical protein HBH55_248700 [Parastagonospora nodorum]